MFDHSGNTTFHSLHGSILNELAPWFFSVDWQNYACWLPAHLEDITEWKEKHPIIAREFSNGKFCVQRSVNKFSAISLNQAHVQMNDKLKGDGGMIGLTENSNGLRRWMVSGPEVTRVVQQFEGTADEEFHKSKSSENDMNHTRIFCGYTEIIVFTFSTFTDWKLNPSDP